MPAKRRVFVSYHHDADTTYYDQFVGAFSNAFEVLRDHSVDRQIDSDDPVYVMRRIREKYLTGASVTVVLCGRNTPGRKYVDWEISASLGQRMGLIGLKLPTVRTADNGGIIVPDRYYDNYRRGYAKWLDWGTIVGSPLALSNSIEASLQTDKALIDDSRLRKRRNDPIV